MDLTKLFKAQKKLDQRIVKEHGLQGEDLLDKKILALQVELGELANELPEVFKFWSNKKNNYVKALKEYVDGLHFVLSIGNDIKETFLADSLPAKKADVSDLLASLFEITSTFKSFNYMDADYQVTLSLFLKLGLSLGFTWKQIEEAYFDKNEENHRRQSNGY